MSREKATREEFLLWFFQYADFGPSDGDVRRGLYHAFMRSTGKDLPDGFGSEGEDDEG